VLTLSTECSVRFFPDCGGGGAGAFFFSLPAPRGDPADSVLNHFKTFLLFPRFKNCILLVLAF